jgi:hypothetical protein
MLILNIAIRQPVKNFENPAKLMKISAEFATTFTKQYL